MYLRGMNASNTPTEYIPLNVSQYETAANGYDTVANSYTGNLPVTGGITQILQTPVIGPLKVRDLIIMALLAYVFMRKGK